MPPRANPPTPAITFATLNPNGLNDASKRRTVFHMLRNKYDGVGVSFITETHAADRGVAEGWLREGAGPGLPWEGPSAWAFGGPASCGVAVLVHASIKVESFQPVSVCPRGRFVGAFAELDRQPFLLFSVYAPCVAEHRVPFFSEELAPAIREAVRRFPTAQLVVGGDFNCIESASRDQSAGCGSRLVGFEGGLRPLQVEFALVDSYRVHNPGGSSFTHKSTGGTSARLDRILVGEDVMANVTRADMGDGWPGDHRLAYVSARLPRALPRGPGDWVFPRSLLCDPDFVSEFTAHFEAWFARHPLSPSLSAGQRWENFKRFARDRIRLYELKLAERRKKGRVRLERAAAVAARAWAERPDCPRAAAAWAAEQQRLQAAREAAAERVARFAGVAWEEYGEQGTAWFHRLAQGRRADCSIPELEVLSGEGEGVGSASARTVSLSCPEGREAAAKHIANFYDGQHPSGLFRPQPTSAAAQEEILGSIDRALSPEDREACEADIAASDLAAALAECEPGKSPGLDGLTYEFYESFWGVLGARLAEVFSEAFGEGGAGRLPESMRMGLIVLVYKGTKAGPRSKISNYRPITLLNCDCKILAKTLARRFAAPLSTVIDDTQTAFLPDRWIGDNVLFHLEEIDYLENTRTPGVIVFMDFEKAYDRVSRPFVLECMRALGFGPKAVGWVGLLLRDTRAACRFNGFHTRVFDVLSGVAQGSPLSPALYLIAAQPLAARLRQLQLRGTLGGIPLPDLSLAPPSAQHADDTTLHLPSLDSLSVAWRLAVEPFCAASGSRAHPKKTKAMLLGGAAGPAPSAEGDEGVHAETGVKLQPRGEALRHLGVMLGPREVGEEARAKKFDSIKGGAVATMKHWAARGLSFHGRAHVAQQCVASTLVYHAAFSRPPPACLAAIQTEINAFVRGGDALCLPCSEVVHLPRRLGGMGVPNLQQVVHALQAGIIQRLLHPARRPWKVLMMQSLRQLTPGAAGARAVFSALVSPPPTPRAGGHGPALPDRLGGYMGGFRACRPHRLVPAEDLPAPAVFAEPMFGNPSVVDGGGPLSPRAFPLASAAGVHSVAALADALSQQPPPTGGLLAELTSLEACLPPAWAALVPSSRDTLQDAFEWWEWPEAGRAARSDHGLQRGAAGPPAVVHAPRDAPAATAYVVGPDGALTAGSAIPWPPPPSRPAGRPCLVARVPRRRGSSPAARGRDAGRGAAAGQGGGGGAPEEEGRLFYIGPWAHGAAAPLDPTQWGLAGSPLLQSTAAGRTHFLLQNAAAESGKSTAAGCELGRAARPAAWDGTLERREQGWLGALAPPGLGRAAPQATQGADPFLQATARWMAPNGPRLLPAQRAQQREESSEQQQHSGGGAAARRPPHARWLQHFDDPRAGRPDGDPPPWAGAWRRLHRTPAPREHRFIAWRAMHGALPVAAHPAVWNRRVPQPTTCHRACCSGLPETVTHAFVSCPVAQSVWHWAGRLWEAVAGFPPPPFDVRSLLGGDTRGVPPPPPSPPPSTSPRPAPPLVFWHSLRVCIIYHIWVARCRGRVGGGGDTALAIAARVVAHMRAALRMDAIRAFCAPRAFAELGGDWLPDRPPIGLSALSQRWGPAGKLFGGDSLPTFTVLLTLVHPVPPPPCLA